MATKKIPNIAILSTKGGVGKSTLSFEIVAPYLLKLGHIPEVRLLDDCNEDEADYFNTSLNINRIAVGGEGALTNNVYKAIELGDQGVVIDVGGNVTCNAFINALAANEDYVDEIDLFIIPINNNGSTIKNAINTINLFKDKQRLKSALGRIAIAINQCDFGATEEDLRESYYNAFDIIDKDNLKWIAVNAMNRIENLTQLFGLTSYEVAQQKAELMPAITEEFRALIQQNRAGELVTEEQQKHFTETRRKRSELTKNEDIHTVSVNSAFAQLDSILK